MPQPSRSGNAAERLNPRLRHRRRAPCTPSQPAQRNKSQVALVWLWYGFGMALVWLWYGFGMALVWLWCGFGMALVWLWCGFGVALRWPWVGFVLRSICLVYAYYMALRWL